MKHFEIDKDKNVCGIGIGFLLNQLYDQKYKHRFVIVVLFCAIAFIVFTKNKIGK